ncbi:MAG TPA: hypothetical protein VGC08_05570, partial [Pedobacter sp.]
YLKKNDIPELDTIWSSLISSAGCALIGGMAARMFLPDIWLAIPFSILLYLILLVLTAQLKLNDRENFRSILNW